MDRDVLKEKILSNKIINPRLKQLLTQTGRHVEALLPHYLGSEAVRQNKAMLFETMLGFHKINQTTPLGTEFRFLGGLDRDSIFPHYSDFADKEIKNNFSTLFANSIVSLFTTFDATLQSFVMGWYQNHYAELNEDVKNKIGVFPEDIDEPDTFWKDLEKLYKSDIKRIADVYDPHPLNRVDYVEIFLRYLGLPEHTFDADVVITLHELQFVRNLIVHHGSIVNGKFKDTCCPWMNVTIGDKLTFGLKDYERYDKAVRFYFGRLIDGIVELYS